MAKRNSDYEIIIDDNDLKNAGFEKVSIKNRDMVITFVNGSNKRPVLSRYKDDDLTATLKSLRKELINKGIDKQSIQRLEIFLSEKLIQKRKELATEKEDSVSTTDIQKIREEIENYRKSIGPISMKEWQTGVSEKYQYLKETVKSNLPSLWPGLEFVLATKSILNIKRCTLPFAGILLGPPSCLKTVILELFRKWLQTYYTDNFSARSFVSHSTAVSKEQLQEIDMLPRIKDKLFITPELAPTFGAKDDDLIQVLTILTRILDGHGYESDSGAHGHRGYNERMMFVWVGAAVDIPRKVHKHLATLGPKLYFLRLSKSTSKSEDDYYKELDDDFDAKIKEIHNALLEYLKYFEICPQVEMENGLTKISWNSANTDEEAAIRHIIKVGRLLARLRGVVPTWETYGTQGSDYSYGMATIEEPGRAITQLRNLARGHALSKGRNHINLEDIPLVIKVVLSTASIERATIFDILISHKGSLTTSQITSSLDITAHTAHRTMAELRALALVDGTGLTDKSNTEKKIKLKDEFSWFLSEEFQALRESFEEQQRQQHPHKQQDAETEHEEKDPLTNQKNENVYSIIASEEVRDDIAELEEKSPPTNANLASANQQLEEKIPITSDDNSSLLNKDNTPDLIDNSSSKVDLEPKEEEKEIKFTPDYEAGEPIFWCVFEELSNANNGLVDYDKLQQRLVSIGKFYVGEAVLMIEHMEKIGKIELTGAYNIYRIKKLASPNEEEGGSKL